MESGSIINWQKKEGDKLSEGMYAYLFSFCNEPKHGLLTVQQIWEGYKYWAEDDLNT